MNVSALLDFHRGTGTDHAGRRREEILAWGPERLEGVHDYIQWLFPLPEPSGVNPHAPLVQPRTAAAFAEDPALRERLRRSFERMLGFYGLERQAGADGRLAVRRSPAFAERSRVWLRPHDHNFLRLSRILASLRHLGLPEEAEALFACLEALCASGAAETVGSSLSFWRRAARG